LEDVTLGVPFKNSVFGIKESDKEVAVSWWVSPKRTRSYPYARVYDTLGFTGKKITIIPFVKDEGANGDRDFVQWDTISLMSLLGVYVILAYYVRATRSIKPGKITNQEFDYNFIANRIEKVMETKLSPHEWNIYEIQNQLKFVAQKSKEHYEKIQNATKVKLHNLNGIDRYIKWVEKNIEEYRDRSRLLSAKAQKREVVTLQPKEDVTIARKGMIVLKNQIGGNYLWTVDEIITIGNRIFLIEKKYSKKEKVPSLNDIKDGFLKLIIFNNISKLTDTNNKELKFKVCLGLTSEIGTGSSWNFIPYSDKKLNLSSKEFEVLKDAFKEGAENGIIVYYLGRDAKDFEEDILRKVKLS
ncbi:MAG: hypothetical protein NC827_09785, partial [Candidatus Omnitrophica bacterium]|nr:hypothetical protein [Candidatus Omnitrophota bacterium]